MLRKLLCHLRKHKYQELYQKNGTLRIHCFCGKVDYVVPDDCIYEPLMQDFTEEERTLIRRVYGSGAQSS